MSAVEELRAKLRQSVSASHDRNALQSLALPDPPIREFTAPPEIPSRLSPPPESSTEKKKMRILKKFPMSLQ